MKHISQFSEWKPIPEIVKDYLDILYKNYQVKDFQNYKIVLIDDKIYYFSGPFVNKGNLTNKIFSEVYDKYLLHSSHEPSLRRAIKNWIDSNSK